MSADNDGGHAFPTLFIQPEHGSGYKGMSLRDYFAAAALVGMAIPDDGRYSEYDRENGHPKLDALRRAEIAYRNADAMLAARKGGAS